MNDCIYVIVPFSEVTQQMINDCHQSSFDTLRHSISGVDRVILKWCGDTPSSLSGYVQYTHSQILAEINGPDWTDIESSSSSSE